MKYYDNKHHTMKRETIEQAFEWWISNENAADWLSNKRNQQNLFNYDNHKTF